MKHHITKQSIKGDGSATNQKTYEDFNKKKPDASDVAEEDEPSIVEADIPEKAPVETSQKVHHAAKDKSKTTPMIKTNQASTSK